MSRQPKRNSEALSGAELKAIREQSFQLTQAEMAALLGIGYRTYLRFEGSERLDTDIPLCHAKHIRCLLKNLGK
ncbi:helix-turn-helix domain-containing protein [Fimbriiglobus ruber]|uniref:HTH cro/C1-type domain-containing protein n=1 Tax=Fimbriiglobus ruber TaxID=1908690 RepID=A0A225CYP3_9BACT|nr:hypothetical protein [Fimbriiglobus ruber]OWK34362.1 hypothetical protein FRUB_10333 [Fimbriiglobus ruber]